MSRNLFKTYTDSRGRIFSLFKHRQGSIFSEWWKNLQLQILQSPFCLKIYFLKHKKYSIEWEKGIWRNQQSSVYFYCYVYCLNLFRERLIIEDIYHVSTSGGCPPQGKEMLKQLQDGK